MERAFLIGFFALIFGAIFMIGGFVFLPAFVTGVGDISFNNPECLRTDAGATFRVRVQNLGEQDQNSIQASFVSGPKEIQLGEVSGSAAAGRTSTVSVQSSGDVPKGSYAIKIEVGSTSGRVTFNCA